MGTNRFVRYPHGQKFADDKLVRRELDADESRRLLNSARTGPTRFGMTGVARAVLYEQAATTEPRRWVHPRMGTTDRAGAIDPPQAS